MLFHPVAFMDVPKDHKARLYPINDFIKQVWATEIFAFFVTVHDPVRRRVDYEDINTARDTLPIVQGLGPVVDHKGPVVKTEGTGRSIYPKTLDLRH
jgi:hypothetical protein